MFTGCLPVLQDVQRHVRIQISLLAPPWTTHGIQFSASCLGFTRQQKNTWSTQKFGRPNIAYAQVRFSRSGAFCEGPIVFRFKDLSSGITAPQLEEGLWGLTSMFSGWQDLTPTPMEPHVTRDLHGQTSYHILWTHLEHQPPFKTRFELWSRPPLHRTELLSSTS